MKLSNLLIVSSAFSLAIAGTAMNYAQKDEVLLRIVATDPDSICRVFPETIEDNCALLNTGPQCSVWYEEDGTADVLLAYITPLALPLCALPLRTRN
ncbi:hypothetical protein [Parachryseolinea silvisoli]|jgi:hypothetical protein|uniref:hypothetical protein n=1 Tax=Parachryseolinea silvisoli TaxID=2873601 RepID=UPI00226591C2|nr:hypothetical protein [Parachryseolinea silvisoli]MCD9018903.1 hypothetical protein [Parachryseolinea silvisoli]